MEDRKIFIYRFIPPKCLQKPVLGRSKPGASNDTWVAETKHCGYLPAVSPGWTVRKLEREVGEPGPAPRDCDMAIYFHKWTLELGVIPQEQELGRGCSLRKLRPPPSPRNRVPECHSRDIRPWVRGLPALKVTNEVSFFIPERRELH